MTQLETASLMAREYAKAMHALADKYLDRDDLNGDERAALESVKNMAHDVAAHHGGRKFAKTIRLAKAMRDSILGNCNLCTLACW